MIELQPCHIQVIRTHAESTYPEECCGILLGTMADDGKTLVEVRQTENAWSAAAEFYPSSESALAKTSRYLIAPTVLLQAQREARDRQLHIIGIYHSHPDHAAIPSEFDLIYAWQQYSYIIVAVYQGKAGELLSWRLDHQHQFQQEEMISLPLLNEP